MTDIVDPMTRSRMMAGIRGRDTAPERVLRQALHARGFRFRLNVRKLPGSPDIVLPRWKAVVMVHGCFWHRHAGCRFASTPATRSHFWQTKFGANVARDRRAAEELHEAGWRLAIVWECSLRKKPEAIANAVGDWIRSGEPMVEF